MFLQAERRTGRAHSLLAAGTRFLTGRLVLGALTVGSLLCVYILCVNLERPLSWSMVPLKHFRGFALGASSGPQDSEDPLDGRSGGARWTPSPPAPSTLRPAPSTLRPAPSTLHPAPSTLHPELPPGTVLHERTPAPSSKTAAHKPAPADGGVPGASESSPRSDAVDGTGTRSGTEGPTPPSHRPTQAAVPTEPPFIGDTYTSEDTPPLTDCADGVRSRVADTEFGGRFLKGVPVLQRAELATQEQYRRLSQYAGAHGWGGIDFNSLVETLSVLNSSANRRMLDDWEQRGNKSTCIRCAVVGNGGILKDSKRGKEIDEHHYVFRTNGAIIKGFEQDVGSRTTHYTFSTNTLMNSMRSYAGVGYRGPPVSNETRYVFLPDHDRDYLLMKAAATHTRVQRGPERNKDPTKYFGEDVSAEKLKMYFPDFIRYLRNRFLRSNALKTKYKNIYRPSTGAVMLLAALHTCDQVSAYGFMTPDYKNYSDHYYDNIYHPVGFFINHDLRLEMTLWQQLHQAGLIRLYMHK